MIGVPEALQHALAQGVWLAFPFAFLGGLAVGFNPCCLAMGQSLTSAFLAGMLLSVLVGSCGTPILVALLSYAAVQGNLLKGGTLMLLYGLGSGIPLLLAGTLAAKVTRRWLADPHRLDQAAGLILLTLGYYLNRTLA